MAGKLVILLVSTVLICQESLQDATNNEVEEDDNPFAEAVSALFKDSNGEGLGNVIQTFMHSNGGKHIGDMLSSVAQNNNIGATAQILQGLGSLMMQNADGRNQGGASIDPALVGNILGMLGNKQKEEEEENEGFDMGSIISTVGGMFLQDGPENVASYFPTILNTLSAFVGPEAERREERHSKHASSLPPIIEKAHVLFDHFIHSDFGVTLLNKIGGEKFIMIFSDENGKFSYPKFVEMLENKSFRRHWILMITQRVAEFISYFADPYAQKRFMSTTQFFVNNFLKGQGVPKSALFDPARPTETISALINHLSKRFFNHKIDSVKYVKPAVKYVRDIFTLAEEKGILGKAIDSSKLSNKLADTLNLEIIEPVARVNRAFRFAMKTPKCDKYVICLVNQPDQDEDVSLPGLKGALSKGASIISIWFLSGRTGTSFWSLYTTMMEEINCQVHYYHECHDFHIEEVKVTTEYVHSEL